MLRNDSTVGAEMSSGMGGLHAEFALSSEGGFCTGERCEVLRGEESGFCPATSYERF